jgi:hypothetical protein
MMNKVRTFTTDEEIVKVTKGMRKDVAKHPEFHGMKFIGGNPNPSEFSWAIFAGIDDDTPIKKSENWINK